MIQYSEQFYRELEDAKRSAHVIVPLILNLVRPKTVIDIGCGLGAWLATFKHFGVEDVWGMDGHWLDPRMLQIPRERFSALDLTRPFRRDRRFDLVVSIEVAEHLPPASAPGFVDSLVRLGDLVLFSAAIPYQGGTNHVNEQWQSYWAEHFHARGYVPIDCIRHKIWDLEVSKVKRIYAQNMLLYAREDALGNYPSLKSELEHTRTAMLSLVHPKFYLDKVASPPPEMLSLRYTLSILPRIIANAFLQRIKRALSLLR